MLAKSTKSTRFVNEIYGQLKNTFVKRSLYHRTVGVLLEQYLRGC